MLRALEISERPHAVPHRRRLQVPHAHPGVHVARADGGQGRHRGGEDRQRQDARVPAAGLHQGQAGGDEGRLQLRPHPRPRDAGHGAHARALPADLRGERPLRQAGFHHHGLRLRRRAEARAAAGARGRPALRRGDARPVERLPQGRLLQARPVPLPRAGRGRPHAGHGLPAPDQDAHPGHPAPAPDHDVQRHVAARGAASCSGVLAEPCLHPDWLARGHCQQGH
mmetsp:Transcript_63338/g.196524  ORF Transcript_63338/g.196524 Transcript_63338/m.196524 type:complete len:225 (+) Transcript_63338:149-823(+)